MHFAKERILSNEEAATILQREMPPYFVCARGLKGEVSCNVGHQPRVRSSEPVISGMTIGRLQGDSGGPLTVEDDDGHPILVGIVSHRYSDLCSQSKAHVCTRITSFLPWIAAVTRVPLNR